MYCRGILRDLTVRATRRPLASSPSIRPRKISKQFRKIALYFLNQLRLVQTYLLFFKMSL